MCRERENITVEREGKRGGEGPSGKKMMANEHAYIDNTSAKPEVNVNILPPSLHLALG